MLRKWQKDVFKKACIKRNAPNSPEVNGRLDGIMDALVIVKIYALRKIQDRIDSIQKSGMSVLSGEVRNPRYVISYVDGLKEILGVEVKDD